MVGGYLWNLESTGSTKVSVVADLCKRVRYRESSCRRCVDFCPESAIALDAGPSVSDDCRDCGLCQVACPTEVFRSSLQTDYYLLNQTPDLRPRSASAGKSRRLSIRCREAEESEGDALCVACLGRINENIILGAALLGFDDILLRPGDCPRCRLNQGESLLGSSLASSRALLDALGLEGVTVEVGKAKGGSAAILARRELLKGFGDTIKSRLGSFLCSKERAVRERLGIDGDCEDSPTSQSRATLLALLAQWRFHNDGVVGNGEGLPWRVIRIDEETCTACGICSALCPTGAIFTESGDDWVTLCLQNSTCTNCSLCVEACPEDAVEFGRYLSVAELLDAEVEAAVRVEVAWCAVCGEEIRAGDGSRCPTCEKRQIHPQTLGM